MFQSPPELADLLLLPPAKLERVLSIPDPEDGWLFPFNKLDAWLKVFRVPNVPAIPLPLPLDPAPSLPNNEFPIPWSD